MGKEQKIRVLDLFSGIGNFSLGLRWAGMRTVAFCEIEKFPRSVLKKHWPDIPIFQDVRDLHVEDLPEAVDLICGGYPCQPFSYAGERRGTRDHRHLWPEVMRLIREFHAAGHKPDWCLFENVAGHVTLGLDQVLFDLEREGYSVWTIIVPACAVNAPHRRDRVWIIAKRRQAAWKRIRTTDRHDSTAKTGRTTGRYCCPHLTPTAQPGWGGQAGRAARTCNQRWLCSPLQQLKTPKEKEILPHRRTSGRLSVVVARLLPTPTASGNNNRKGSSPAAGDGLATKVKKGGPLKSGCLSARFVEQMMGLPLNWTEVKD